MANSGTVTAGSAALASQYNNLRDDVLDVSTGHTHTGAAEEGKQIEGSAIASTGAADGAVLTADGSGAASFLSVVSGGLTPIATATPSAATTVSFTSIPTTYKHLVIQWVDVFQSAGSVGWDLRFNSDSGSNYGYTAISVPTGATAIGRRAEGVTTAGKSSSEAWIVCPSNTIANSFENANGTFILYRYTDLAPRQFEWHARGSQINQGASSRMRTVVGSGVYKSSGSAVTDIEFIRQSTQTITGTFYLYGVS
jgi:hypothetical protein